MPRSISIAIAALLVSGVALGQAPILTIKGTAPFRSGAYRVLAAEVPYGDLDPATKVGASTLYERLKAASHAVCAEKFAGGYIDHELAVRYADCRADAVKGVIDKARLPVLTEVASISR
jgi:UrcA family protein